MTHWYQSLRDGYEQFVRATRSPVDFQTELLRELVAHTHDSAFGRDHGLDRVTSVVDYREAVPIRTIEDLAPYLARAFDGEDSVLYPGAPVFFARTSGTTGRPKHIPYSGHEAVARRQTTHWLGRYAEEQLAQMVVILGTYHEDTSPGGVPIGSASGFVRWANSDVPAYSAIPHAVLELSDPKARYYGILRLLLGVPVRTLGVINPSTIVALLEHLREFGASLVSDLREGGWAHAPDATSEALQASGRLLQPDPERASHVDKVLSSGDDSLGDCFPDLEELHTWKDGSVGLYLPQVEKAFPSVRLRRLTSGSSEGAILIPTLSGVDECTIAPATSFFEYLPAEREPTNAALVDIERLEVDSEYRLVISNFRGMYRLLSEDVLVMVGRDGAMPLFRFRRRAMMTSSVTGEKLTGHHVEAAFLGAISLLSAPPRELQLALDWREGARPRYAVIMAAGRSWCDDDSLRAFLHEFERRLCEQNSEYAAKRSSARLDSPILVVVRRDYFTGMMFKATAERLRSDAQYKLPSLANAPLNREQLPLVKQLEF